MVTALLRWIVEVNINIVLKKKKKGRILNSHFESERNFPYTAATIQWRKIKHNIEEGTQGGKMQNM